MQKTLLGRKITLNGAEAWSPRCSHVTDTDCLMDWGECVCVCEAGDSGSKPVRGNCPLVVSLRPTLVCTCFEQNVTFMLFYIDCST
jgi:hypothetical protein